MKDNIKIFEDKYGLELIISYRKSAIIFEVNNIPEIQDEDNFQFIFDSRTFKELFEYLYEIANKSWTDIQLKECNSMGSDYAEYYDRKLDNNGYLGLRENKLIMERVSEDNNKLYQFNKPKIQSFLYDFKKLIK